MFEQIVTRSDVGTYYATENAQLPSLECPRCDNVTPLQKLVSDQECETCGLEITLKMFVGE
jgi:hypothetical protein